MHYVYKAIKLPNICSYIDLKCQSATMFLFGMSLEFQRQPGG